MLKLLDENESLFTGHIKLPKGRLEAILIATKPSKL
jgi:hypothetical protein